MANPQPTDAHLRIAHSINEQLMVSFFTEQQRRVLDLILRLSWGCGKKEAIIPNQRDFEIVGVGEGHVKAHLDWLIEAKVIIREDDRYAFNKDFDVWRVSRAFKYSPEKLTELVRLNLNGTYGKGKVEKGELTEKVSRNLRKTEEVPYGKGKVATPKLAMAKESIKERLKKDILLNKEQLPEWLNKETWDAFLEMRKEKKDVPTAYAVRLLFGKLEKLKLDGDDPNEVLNRSIMNGWKGIFPLDHQGGQHGKRRVEEKRAIGMEGMNVL